MLKSRVCPKKPFPYGDNTDKTYYNPGCITDMYKCKDLSGKKCGKACSPINHDGVCSRRELLAEFMACPSRNQLEDDNTIQYISYELVQDTAVKEGKKPYKKMECIREDISIEHFITKFKENFQSFAKHKLEA